MKEPAERDRDALILRYQAFVHQVVGSLIKKMKLPSLLFDEYVSAGYIGLVEAAERFDFSHGKDFKNYAYLRIRGAVIDSIRRSADVPGYIYSKYVKALKAAHELREEMYERERSGKNHCADKEMLAEVFEYLSLSALTFRISQHDAEAEMANLEDSAKDPAAAVQARMDTEFLLASINELPEMERHVITQHYFEEMTFSDIANALGDISKSWVSRLHARALKLLRNKYCEAHAI